MEFKWRKVPREVSLMVRRGSDEVKEEDVAAEEVSDGAEWSNARGACAAEALSRFLSVFDETEPEPTILP